MIDEKTNSKIISNIQDGLLKEKLVDFWFNVMNHYMQGKLIQSFQGLKIVFPMIQGYNFIDKDNIEELISTIDEYVEGLNGRPTNQKDLIVFNESKVMFKELVYQLSTLLAQAFIDLDLWFKTVKVSNDIDVKLSQDNFKDELTLVEKKRNSLKNLKTDMIISLMSYNSIHDVYARGVRQNVL